MEQNKLSYQDQCLSVLIEQELKRANNKFPLFSSEHEAYAVLLEEVEEVEVEIQLIKARMDSLWEYVKSNCAYEYQSEKVKQIKEDAINGIQELMQVAAMCDKWEMSLKK